MFQFCELHDCAFTAISLVQAIGPTKSSSPLQLALTCCKSRNFSNHGNLTLLGLFTKMEQYFAQGAQKNSLSDFSSAFVTSWIVKSSFGQ